MKTFVTVTENCALLGISREQSLQKYPFNRRNVIVAFILTFCAISNCFYFFHEAETFNEFAISAYTTLTHIVSVITFFIAVLQMRLCFNLIHYTETILNKSEQFSINFNMQILILSNFLQNFLCC